jgi:hypothetical protein
MNNIFFRTTKLNNNLINIIRNYIEVDIKKLISTISDHRISLLQITDMSITNLIVKSIQIGYKGFSISKFHYYIIENLTIPINILKLSGKNYYQFCFKGDGRDLFFIDIHSIPGAIKYIDLIVKN